MEKVLINGKEYVFIKNYKDDIMLRRSYNSITLKTYGFVLKIGINQDIGVVNIYRIHYWMVKIL